MNKRALVDFFLTLVLLGAAFALALASTVLAGSDGRLAAGAAIASLVLALGGGLYIVPKLARRVTWEFANYATRTSVTSEGLLFLSLVTIVGVAAWNTENNLLYLILSAMLAFIVASGTVSRWMLRDLAVKLRFPDHLYAGQPARLSVTLDNKKPLIPSCSITVEAHAARDEGAAAAPVLTKRRRRGAKAEAPLRLAHFIVVPPRSEARQVVEQTFDRRGRYRIDGFTLVTRFPSGFFKKWRRVSAEGEIVVFPRVRPVDDFFHTLPMLAGSAESAAKGEGIDLHSLRDYRTSDHLRRIDWKASAKTRRVMVRETLDEEDRRLMIFFDPSRPPLDGAEAEAEFAEKFERAVEAAASLADHFVGEGSDVGLVTPTARIEAGRGRGHLNRILAELAVAVPTLAAAELDGEDAAWGLGESLPGLGDDHTFKVLFTSAPHGAIPGRVWRSSRVVHVGDL